MPVRIDLRAIETDLKRMMSLIVDPAVICASSIIMRFQGTSTWDRTC